MRIEAEVPIKLITRLMVVLIGVILALRVSEFAVYAVGALVFYTMLQKRVEFSFFALMVLVSLAIMNNMFFPKDFNFYLITRVSIMLLALVMGAKAGTTRSAWFLAPFFWLYAYLGLLMLTSLAGWAPVISEMKAALFLFFITALIQSTSAVVQSGVDITFIRGAMLTICSFFILGSVLTIPFPAVGQSMMLLKAEAWGMYLDAEEVSGMFNGVTWHSQTLGPALAILNAFLLSDYLCNIKRRHRLYWALIAAVPVLVYMTSSRTALFAYLLSLAASVFFFMGERRASAAKKARTLTNLLFALLFAGSVLLARPGGIQKAEAFLRKASDVSQMDTGRSLGESLTSSRMGLVEQGLANFRRSPLIGNGFQVSEQMQAYDASEMGLLLSAPIEKGVLPIMVLEEGGVLGALFFSAFIISIYVKYRRLQFTCFLSTFTVFIGLNSGEATFFSTSGSGGILWMVCFCALLMDIHRHRRRLAEQNEQRLMLNRPGLERA